MENLEDLTHIARAVENILKNELKKTNINSNLAQVRVYDIKTVGVQGDQRSYSYPAEITLFSRGEAIWQPDFLGMLSNKITNEIKDINRVVYVIAVKK